MLKTPEKPVLARMTHLMQIMVQIWSQKIRF